MEIIIQPDSKQASDLAARIVAKVVREKPRAVLGFATGQTPVQLYARLAQMSQEQAIDLSMVTTFNLDEYMDLPGDHPASFRTFMKRHLFDKVNIPVERINLIDGLIGDVPAYCRHYETAIRTAGGIDLQILGIGRNGHIGFNEPSSSLASRTRIKSLTDQTRQSLIEDFGSLDRVPKHVLTMGLGTIMESRACLLLAFGKAKARAIAQAVEGPVMAMVPASILQMHSKAVVVLDKEAAAELKMADYYSWVYAHKPDWQKY